MLRKILILIAAFVVIFGGSGCMQSGQESSGGTGRVNINDQALAYMEEKYGETFKYVRPTGNSMSGTHELIVSCESLPEKDVLVEIADFQSDHPTFMDNYLAVKYEQETRNFLHECAASAFGEAEVFYEVAQEGQSISLSADASFSDFLLDTRVPLIATIEVNSVSLVSDEQSLRFGELVAERGSQFYFTIFDPLNGEYGTLDLTTINRKIGRREFDYCSRVSNYGEEIKVVQDRRE